jgi:protein-tyrosine phosphatase
MSREARAPLLAADPEYLEAAFDAIESAHGSLEGYLRDRLRVSATALERMRKHLLEP